MILILMTNSDNAEDYGDEGRVYRVMCREEIIEE
jgi:hypothetical protein